MLGGDDAKQYLAEDEFDLKKLVNVLVETLTHRIDADGYVLGIEGSWGSGKSSFVNFVANEIRDKAPKHRVIQFQPWLIGARDALLAAFFAQFAAVIDDIPSSGLSLRDRCRRRRVTRTLAKKLRSYGKYASALGSSLSGLAIADHTGATGLLAAGLSIGRGCGTAAKDAA